jgi:glutathione synthase/RimK-type ligase-like ATP-grasp enzyme
MASGHWQIIQSTGSAERRYGKVHTVPVAEAPPEGVQLALRAARTMGDGFYGVDIKDIHGRFVVMEVNDNPSIEAGYEDTVLKDKLYESVMRLFLERLEKRSRLPGDVNG